MLLRRDFDKGLEREGDDVVVKMLNTYVHSLPDGTEKGKFLALDLGGSNFRVLLIGKTPPSFSCRVWSFHFTFPFFYS